MNLLADESIDRQIVDRLRQDGHLVHYVVEMEPGVPDDIVLDLANQIRGLLENIERNLPTLASKNKFSSRTELSDRFGISILQTTKPGL